MWYVIPPLDWAEELQVVLVRRLDAQWELGARLRGTSAPNALEGSEDALCQRTASGGCRCAQGGGGCDGCLSTQICINPFPLSPSQSGQGKGLTRLIPSPLSLALCLSSLLFSSLLLSFEEIVGEASQGIDEAGQGLKEIEIGYEA